LFSDEKMIRSADENKEISQIQITQMGNYIVQIKTVYWGEQSNEFIDSNWKHCDFEEEV